MVALTRAAFVLATVLVPAVAGTASAGVSSRVGSPVSPPETIGADGSGRLSAQVKAPGDGRRYGLALIERTDIPLYAPGTVAECYYAGEKADLDDMTAGSGGPTCTPPRPDQLSTGVAVHHPRARISARRFRRLRRADRRLPGVTLLSGRVSAQVKRVTITTGRRKRSVRTRPALGGFIVAYRGWLEDATIKVRLPSGRTATHRIGRAKLVRNPDGSFTVGSPRSSTTVEPPADAPQAR